MDDPIDGAAFTTWVDRHHGSPARGDATVVDNLSVHEVRSARKLLKDTGVELLVVPPYNPEPNPVEMIFAGCKHRFERPTNTPRMLHGAGSGLSSTSLSPANARDTFVMPAMR